MDIKQLCEESHEIAKEHGWWNTDRSVQEAILMIITELTEAVQKDRSNDWNGFLEEIADTYIRLSDLVGYLDVDIEPIIKAKMEINKGRPYKHEKNY